MHQSLASKAHQKKRNWTRRSKFRANAVRQAFVSASGSPSLQALLVAFAMMIVFTIRPDIDLEVSRQFWADGFTLGEDEFLIAVRDLNRMLPAVLLSGLAGMLFAMPFSRGLLRLFPPHKLLFIMVFFALGPGATVHALKNLFGRARPRHLAEFGESCFLRRFFPSMAAAPETALFLPVKVLPQSPSWPSSSSCQRNFA